VRNVSVKQPILMGTVISTSPKKTPVNPSLGLDGIKPLRITFVP